MPSLSLGGCCGVLWGVPPGRMMNLTHVHVTRHSGGCTARCSCFRYAFVILSGFADGVVNMLHVPHCRLPYSYPYDQAGILVCHCGW